MNLVWSNPALLDLRAIRDYIARDSEHYALRLIQRIMEAAERIRKIPELGQVVPECGSADVRERRVQNYRIIYRVREDHVLIIAVVHGRRDLGSLDV
jgi:toxin ParE1/3/4